MTTTDPVTRDTVRTALIELLSTGYHRDTASAVTLAAVADTRERLDTSHGGGSPASRHAPSHDRHAALSSALGDISGALLVAARHDPDPTRLRAGLTAVALAWLDTLTLTPTTDTPDA
ncbi:MAG: hypothetical protein ACRDRI_05660 [Pseudonocardiaceae bacterium]